MKKRKNPPGICKSCGNPIVGRSRGCTLCSECALIHKSRNKAPINETCVWCGKPTLRGAKYCSPECKKKGEYANCQKGNYPMPIRSGKKCDRAGGAACAHWRPFDGYSLVYACMYLLDTGSSTGYGTGKLKKGDPCPHASDTNCRERGNTYLFTKPVELDEAEKYLINQSKKISRREE